MTRAKTVAPIVTGPLHWLAAALLPAALLAGCGTSPISPGPGAGPTPEPAPTVRPGGGGYYQDDGPDALPPVGLDQVPDAVPREEPLHRYANRPYTVMGQEFTPATRLQPFRERGKASWYGRKFHGKPTASGEPYDMYKMTAAHPTLPIPSYARVTNLANGRSVVVRINDRGPFLHRRVIDLSYTAAHKLDYLASGSAQVEVEAILPGEVAMVAAERPVPPLRRPGVPVAPAVESVAVSPSEVPQAVGLPPLALPADGADGPASGVDVDGAEVLASASDSSPGALPMHYLQLGAFASRENAEDFRSMAAAELKEAPERLQIVPAGMRFRLHLGPYATVEEARERAEAVGAALRIQPFVTVR